MLHRVTYKTEHMSQMDAAAVLDTECFNFEHAVTGGKANHIPEELKAVSHRGTISR